MTTIAEKFIDELKQGQISEAIKTISEHLTVLAQESINKTRLDILESYGFEIAEASEKDKKDPKVIAAQDQGEGDAAKSDDDDDDGDGGVDDGDGDDGGEEDDDEEGGEE